MMDLPSKDGYCNSNGHKIEVWSQHIDNCKSTHKAAAVAAAWDDCTESVVSNGSSGVFTPSMEEEFADAENQLDCGLTRYSEDPSELLLKVHVMEALISGLFSTVSSLKKSYSRLQSAHAPYDVELLQMADKAVASELNKFSELKQYYKERLVVIGSSGSSEVKTFGVHGELESKQDLTSYEKIMSSFHLEIQSKCMTIDSLNDKLAHTAVKKKKLERQVRRLEQQLARQSDMNLQFMDQSPNPQLLEIAVLHASEASRVFAKLLISLMNTAQWDLDAAANSIEPGLRYVRSKDKKLVFESYIFHRMLNDFESWDFGSDLNGPQAQNSAVKQEHYFEQFRGIRGVDPRESVDSRPGGPFARYCLKKFVELIHPKMEESFFGNMEHRKQVSTGNHPKSQFYQKFLKLAKAMWSLHLLAYSFEPPARIFQVNRNTDFSPLYMESIVRTHETHPSPSNVIPKVGFTVMPGFRVDNTIIKCQVYIAATTS